ncbi:hypothetical protein [Lutibacter sp.]
MKKITFLLLISISLFVFNSCDEEINETKDINYISFESATFDFGVELDGTTALDIKVYSTKITNSDRTFNVNVLLDESSADPASYSVPASVIIPANSNVGLLNISISDINIGENGKNLVLEFATEEGLFTGEKININIKQVCPLNEVFLDITFDSWPEETGWELLDSSGGVVASAQIGDYAGSSSFSTSFCLANGTYTFIIYDAYGDGTDTYKLSYNGSVIVTGGAFGSSESTTFTVNQ